MMNVIIKSSLIAAFALVVTGCTVCRNAHRTILREPRQYSWKADKVRSKDQYRAWAEQNLRQFLADCTDLRNDPHFAQGFRDGFVDYIYAGGTGEPPPVPPRRYWRLGWRLPAGDTSVSQWFAGYREGSSAAQAGGYRENGIVLSSWRSAAAEMGFPMLPESAVPAAEPIDVPPPRVEVSPAAESNEPSSSGRALPSPAVPGSSESPGRPRGQEADAPENPFTIEDPLQGGLPSHRTENKGSIQFGIDGTRPPLESSSATAPAEITPVVFFSEQDSGGSGNLPRHLRLPPVESNALASNSPKGVESSAAFKATGRETAAAETDESYVANVHERLISPTNEVDTPASASLLQSLTGLRGLPSNPFSSSKSHRNTP